MKVMKITNAVCVALIFAVLVTVTGCTPNDRAVAVKSTVAVAQALAAVEALNEDLNAAHVIDNDQSVQVSQTVIKATLVDDALIKTLQASSNTASTQAAVIAALGELTNDVADLENQGVLGIKDPAKKQLFAVSVATVKATLATLQAILQTAAGKV